MQKTKIILADDHQLFRDGIKSLLLTAPNIEIVAEVPDGKTLLNTLETTTTDIILMDISMPGMTGIELTEIIVDKYPNIAVCILSMHNDEEYILNAIKSGVKGYLSKDTSRDELLNAISLISNGNEYYNKSISDIIVKSYVKQTKLESKSTSTKAKLTNRELEIIKLVSEGFMNKEISDKLNISIRTVDSHKSNIMQKLELKSSVDIVKYAIKNNIIEI